MCNSRLTPWVICVPVYSRRVCPQARRARIFRARYPLIRHRHRHLRSSFHHRRLLRFPRRRRRLRRLRSRRRRSRSRSRAVQHRRVRYLPGRRPRCRLPGRRHLARRDHHYGRASERARGARVRRACTCEFIRARVCVCMRMPKCVCRCSCSIMRESRGFREGDEGKTGGGGGGRDTCYTHRCVGVTPPGPLRGDLPRTTGWAFRSSPWSNSGTRK